MTEVTKLIPIELTETECVLFRKLREGGVFDTKNGTLILNFDNMGTLTEIRRNVLTYKNVVAINKS